MKNLPVVSKLAIFGLLTICAGGAIWFLCRPDPPVWRLRTVFHIGTSVNPSSIIEGSPDLQGVVERYAIVVAFISTPIFRETIAEASKFEPASAALSKRLVFDTLRAHALNDYDIEIDLTAASAADCRAAYRTIADRIEQRHEELFDQDAKMLQTAIDDLRERSAQLQKWEDAKVQPGFQPSTDADSPKSNLWVTWNETREHLRQLEAAKAYMTKTTFPAENDVYVNGPLSNNSVRLSALAGLGIILFTLILALGLEIYPSKRRNTDI
ncbi:hypothetical protein [Bradyrhizobium canariense]|uniref:Polysaccharide chain length determinant N-terminal domain-containing protein n=1 Tax=Bradyrhizobium canariense TaxID=255045 RepID=A0A1H1M538_9BRAD|nr:hypothetical protein [Bradyrhizobium canariense]SDR81797.1 hypothetical protein SAMN05444158_0092 [Bradyrhizobium canariense]